MYVKIISNINLRFEAPSEERTVNNGRLRYSFSEKRPFLWNWLGVIV
jgi:hypothetical protein